MDSDLIGLYDYATQHDIDVDWVPLAQATSLSVLLPDGRCSIAINHWRMTSTALETACLAHELGHCETGSFYNPWAKLDVRQKHENRADKWAIKKLVPVDELDSAVADGYTDLWSLADRFGLPVDFMRKVVCWYTHGNLATELYF